MTKAEFEQIVLQDPTLKFNIQRAAYWSKPPGYVGFDLSEAAAIALLFPIVRYVVTEIGFPWLYEAKRYSELWRTKVHVWIDKKYEADRLEYGRNMGAADGLKMELEKISDSSARASWERLAELMKKGNESS